MSKCIVFHSYKGGTGKTTLAANCAALLAKKGYRVFLLDLDVYAPSLQSYFGAEPKKWINDFIYENAELQELFLDFTPLIEVQQSTGTNDIAEGKMKHGQLCVGFCNAKKEEIYKMDEGSYTIGKQKKHLFRRLVLLRELIMSEYDADYIIMDTSSGIRYWSINALVVADALLLTLKMADLDIAGTKELVAEIYRSFTKFGAKSFILWNRVSGYCVPHVQDIQIPYSSTSTITASVLMEKQQATETDVRNFLTRETGMEVISSVPCYCDIQFSRKEFLTVLDQPMHPFSKQFERLVQVIERV